MATTTTTTTTTGGERDFSMHKKRSLLWKKFMAVWIFYHMIMMVGFQTNKNVNRRGWWDDMEASTANILQWMHATSISLKVAQFISMRRQRTITKGGSNTVQLTYSLTCLDSTKHAKPMLNQHNQSSWIQTK